MLPLDKFDNKVFLVEESPRVLLEERGEYYIKKRKYKNIAELVYTIDTHEQIMPISKIIGANTIYCLREVMPFVDIEPEKGEIEGMDVDQVYEWKCDKILNGLREHDFFP